MYGKIYRLVYRWRDLIEFRTKQKVKPTNQICHINPLSQCVKFPSTSSIFVIPETSLFFFLFLFYFIHISIYFEEALTRISSFNI